MSAKKVATFQQRFAELIQSSTKSRTTIAAEFGVAKQTISAWLTGQSSPRLPVITSLAEYFGVSLNWLLGFDVPKIPPSKPQMKLDLFGDTGTPPDEPANDDVRRLIRVLNKLSPGQLDQATNMMKIMFANYFDKE